MGSRIVLAVLLSAAILVVGCGPASSAAPAQANNTELDMLVAAKNWDGVVRLLQTKDRTAEQETAYQAARAKVTEQRSTRSASPPSWQKATGTRWSPASRTVVP